MRALADNERREQKLTPGEPCSRLAIGGKTFYTMMQAESTSDHAQIVRFRHGHF